jgi:hypothetical protein
MHIKLFFIEIDGEQAMTLDKVCKEKWVKKLRPKNVVIKI